MTRRFHDDPAPLTPAPRRGVLRFVSHHPWLMLGMVAVGLLVLAWLIVDKWFDRDLQRAIRMVQARGEPLSMAEIEARRPSVAEADNMALLLREHGDAIGAYLATEEGKALSPKLPYFGTGKACPIGERLPAEQLEAARVFLSDNRAITDGLHEAARLPAGRYPIVVTNPSINTLLPHLSVHRSCVKALSLEALTAASDGRPDAAYDALSSALSLDKALQTEPLLISFFVRIACEALCCQTINDVISLDGLSDAQLADLAARLREPDVVTSLHAAIIAERASLLETLGWAYSSGSVQQIVSPAHTFTGIKLVPGLRHIDQEALVRLMTSLSDAAKLEPAAAVTRVRQIEVEASQLPAYCVGTRILFPSLTRSFDLTFRSQGKNRATQAVLAAERYRLKHGRWPASLDDLVPDFLAAVPADPFDGKPIRYACDAAGIRTWTIGEDMKDDGGEVERYTKLKKATDWGCYLLNPDARGKPASSQPSEN